MARRSRPAAAATDAAILTRGSDFTGSKGSAEIEGNLRRRPGVSYSDPWRQEESKQLLPPGGGDWEGGAGQSPSNTSGLEHSRPLIHLAFNKYSLRGCCVPGIILGA